MAKRSRHTIISEILNICRGGASKTRIVYKVNLNFRTVDPYINMLMDRNMLKKTMGNTVLYETTELGDTIRESFKQISAELGELK